MPEIYVVHMHGHVGGAGGGGFDWWLADNVEGAVDAYRTETGNADAFDVMEVNLYLVECPNGHRMSDEEVDEWVFDNFEAGTPPVDPIAHFMKGEWDD